MTSILIKAYMCADILINHIPGLNVIEISVKDYEQVSPKHLVPDKYREAKYLVTIEFEEQEGEQYHKALAKAKQAIHRALGQDGEPIQGNRKSVDFRNTNCFMMLCGE